MPKNRKSAFLGKSGVSWKEPSWKTKLREQRQQEFELWKKWNLLFAEEFQKTPVPLKAQDQFFSMQAEAESAADLRFFDEQLVNTGRKVKRPNPWRGKYRKLDS